MKLSSLVIEDEPVARDIIKSYVERYEGLELHGEFDSSEDAYQWLKANKVDVLFLDVNLPHMSGVELFKALVDKPQVIFITAYPDYAVDGFELEAVDYLVKPVSYERFSKSVDKLKEKKRINNNSSLLLKSNGRTYPIEQQDIYYLQALGDYIKVFHTENTLIISETMKGIEQKLGPDFIRIHKSYIINRSHVKYIEGNQVRIKDELLPLGATYRDAFLKLF